MLARYSPFERFKSIDRFGKVMDELWGAGNPSAFTWMPPVDVFETEKEVKFVADIPGLTEKDIDIEVQEDVLCIRGERKYSHEEKKDNCIFCERSYGEFERKFRLDSSVKPAQVKATFEKGVLTVTVPKHEYAEPKKIAITAK